MMQLLLFGDGRTRDVAPFRMQLLKWIGNKQRFAHEIASYFPREFGTYFEPFLGAGGVLGTLAPSRAVASDALEPLMQIWQALHDAPGTLKEWYSERWHAMMSGNKVQEYEKIRASYNASPNGADLAFLSRSCYGGVVRFRQADGHISTPCGIHNPIPPDAFSRRVEVWHRRCQGTQFILMDYRDAMDIPQRGDLVYCDPPYVRTQRILYGAQEFSLRELLKKIEECKRRGVYVALSIDGTKKSGMHICDISIPEGLFEREIVVNCGRSMLRRFQMEGQTLEAEVVADRLMLTY